MADRDKYVDIFFRNGLKEYEVLPPPDVWDSIKPALVKHEKSLTLFRVAAIAAILVSLTALSVWLTKDLSDSFTGSQFSLVPETSPAGSYVAGNLKVNSPLVQLPDETQGITKQVSVAEERASETLFLRKPDEGMLKLSPGNNKSPEGIKSAISLSGPTVKKGPAAITIFSLTPGNYLQDNPVPAQSRWTITAKASPSYYSRVNFGAGQAVTDLANNEKPEVSYSGGMGFGFTVNKRVSIQSGVYYSSVGQKVSGISSYSGFSKYNDTKGSSQFSVQTSNGMIVATNNNIYLRDNVASRVITGYLAESIDPAKVNLTPLNNYISQNFNYLEIPVQFKYKAIDRKIDINFIGGLSYNMLVGNTASATVGGVKYSIGETKGLNPVNLSSSLGVGFEYSLSKKFSFDLEPTFRYYLTPFGGQVGSSVHPYSFGIFSGVSYKF